MVRHKQSPIEGEWPSDGLEYVQRCPVCGSAGRTEVHSHLVDRVFFTAPGRWTLHRCDRCGSGYLDPRPSQQTLSLAYRRYFTHEHRESRDAVGLGPLRHHLRALANGYLNARFGTDFAPSNSLGAWTAWLMFARRGVLDALGRGLPKPRPGSRLLDVGCGSGDFLIFARRAGWDATGVDPDPEAVAACHRKGLAVYLGGIDILSQQAERYDAITLSHVVEHVHEPVALLKTCYHLLKAGGYLWVDTPNFASQGHRRFKAAWRGLEPPRHLVLFTRQSLISTLTRVGFVRVQDAPYRPLCAKFFATSEAIANQEDPYEAQSTTRHGVRLIGFELRALVRPEVRELVTLLARKPA